MMPDEFLMHAERIAAIPTRRLMWQAVRTMAELLGEQCRRGGPMGRAELLVAGRTLRDVGNACSGQLVFTSVATENVGNVDSYLGAIASNARLFSRIPANVPTEAGYVEYALPVILLGARTGFALCRGKSPGTPEQIADAFRRQTAEALGIPPRLVTAWPVTATEISIGIDLEQDSIIAVDEPGR